MAQKPPTFGDAAPPPQPPTSQPLALTLMGKAEKRRVLQTYSFGSLIDPPTSGSLPNLVPTCSLSSLPSLTRDEEPDSTMVKRNNRDVAWSPSSSQKALSALSLPPSSAWTTDGDSADPGDKVGVRESQQQDWKTPANMPPQTVLSMQSLPSIHSDVGEPREREFEGSFEESMSL